MDRQRHTRDTAHPMYEIIDNALSDAEGLNTLAILQCVYVNKNTTVSTNNKIKSFVICS